MEWNVKSNEINWNQMKPNEIKWSQMKSIEIKWNQMKSNEIKWNQMKSNEINSIQIKSNQIMIWWWWWWWTTIIEPWFVYPIIGVPLSGKFMWLMYMYTVYVCIHQANPHGSVYIYRYTYTKWFVSCMILEPGQNEPMQISTILRIIRKMNCSSFSLICPYFSLFFIICQYCRSLFFIIFDAHVLFTMFH